VRTAVASLQPLQKTIRTVGRIEYDERMLTTVNTKVEGWVEKLYIGFTGHYVKKGEPLVDIYSPELWATQQEFINLVRWTKRTGQRDRDKGAAAAGQADEKPNTNICPVCTAQPGTLPVLNKRSVELAVKTALVLNCKVNDRCVFARKNYFYPDLPKGYQISQYDMPLCMGGFLSIAVDGAEKRIGITRIHLEEDAGKLVHDQDADSLFDVNRCGTPLIEIVSEPDMRSSKEAYAYLISLKQILEYLGICDCNMEEGSLRCDANISLRPRGETKLGTKIEIKNMNSFRSLEKALDYEALRQADVLRSGGTITQQTFLWDPDTGTSAPMRSKEDAHDYRYFPDPDLVPLVVDPAAVEAAKAELPELPAARRCRFEKHYGIGAYAAEVLTATRDIADYFEETMRHCSDARSAANWIMGEILRIVNDRKCEVGSLKTTPVRFAALLDLLAKGAISELMKRIFKGN